VLVQAQDLDSRKRLIDFFTHDYLNTIIFFKQFLLYIIFLEMKMKVSPAND